MGKGGESKGTSAGECDDDDGGVEECGYAGGDEDFEPTLEETFSCLNFVVPGDGRQEFLKTVKNNLRL